MNEKRQLLIETALALFYQNGINSVGINEVLKVSGVAKKTLYSHFDSKEALILAALEHRHEIFTAWLASKLDGISNNYDLVEKLFHALNSWFIGSEPTLGSFRGCFFINSSAEFSDQNSDISLYCHKHKQEVKNLIGQKMNKEDSLFLDALCIMKEGAITTAYMSGDYDVTDQCIKILNAKMVE
ncbi:TetR/AcrR family transcriptional regulator [Vibrio litoralis]|uniref:TetR/AcrR family transcriptional regulator n=1 Tax=Vibrio litoralis TaxID=335972 RepID=UPI001867A87B|nr:TetR/AcrR family transcriptional regulator [Vibrio litoralis]